LAAEAQERLPSRLHRFPNFGPLPQYGSNHNSQREHDHRVLEIEKQEMHQGVHDNPA
jgi:hypothetical protein